jgi:hypothetical protein
LLSVKEGLELAKELIRFAEDPKLSNEKYREQGYKKE